MYRTILVPTDGSELSDKAADAAIELAKALGSRLVAWSGAEIYVPPFADQAFIDQTRYREQAVQEARERVERLAARAQAAGIACEAVHGTPEMPWKGIIETATDKGCDLIFMASHGRRGIAALLLGSETQKVLTHSTIPVLVYR